jgi:protein SCO1/2
MKSNLQRIQVTIWGLLLFVALAIIAFFIWKKYGAQPTKPLFVYSQVGNFALTNQHNEIVSNTNFLGKIWIADVFFTRCPLQCIRMTKRLVQMQEILPKDGSVRLVSITADPEFDTPTVLEKYATQYGADQSRWSFLTGPKPEINRLVVGGLKLVAYEKKPDEREIPNDLFLHSTRFVLIDRYGRIRGWFDGEKDETKGELVRDVKSLLREKKQ